MSKNDYIKINTLQPNLLKMHTYAADTAGCGYIRTIFPTILTGQMNHNRLEVHASYGMYVVQDPAFYNGMHFVKFQRTATDHQLEYMKYIKQVASQTGTKLIYETDDLTTPDVPVTNHCHDYYRVCWPFIQEMLRLCDGVTVSTDKLKGVFTPYNEKIVVNPNHLPKFLWGEEEWVNRENKKPRILYPGSFNHFNGTGPGGDFAPELIDFIIKTRDKYDWVFVGGVPFELQNMKGIEIHPWQTIFRLPNFLKSLCIDMALAPLIDNIFNQCKSNIKMLEYAALGIPGIYSNVTPYKRASITCDTAEEMISQIETLAINPELRYNTWKADKETVRPILYWEDNQNTLRYINNHTKLFGKVFV